MALTKVEPYIVDSSATYTVGSITVSTSANLGNVANISITGGTAGQVLTSNGNGGVSFANVTTAPVASGSSPMLMSVIFGG